LKIPGNGRRELGKRKTELQSADKSSKRYGQNKGGHFLVSGMEGGRAEKTSDSWGTNRE